MASVLITGAAGFLGTALTRVFTEAGDRVRAGDLPGADLARHEAMGADSVVCDITEPDSIRACLDGIDVVVHAAGIFDLSASESRLRAVNVDGARTVAQAAAEAGVKRFVAVSSTSVYGRCTPRISEDAPTAPVHIYDHSKLDGEQASRSSCEAAGISWAALRPTLIYGPGGRYGMAPALALFAMRHALGHSLLPFSPGGPLSHHVHVHDVARAAHFLAKHPQATGVFNVADDAPIAAGDLIRLICGSVGVRVSNLGLPWFVAPLFGTIKPLLRWYVHRLNPTFVGIWGKLAAQHGFVSALSPKVDVDWMDYLFHAHSYDNRRLKDLGFRYTHPDMREAFPATVAWYRDARWLP